MNRQDEAMRLADELLTDIELSRASTGKYLMKATRLARLTKNDQAQEWLGYELAGVPNSPSGRTWMTKMRRWIDQEKGEGYWSSAPALEAHQRAIEATMAGMGTTPISGEMAIPANRERNQSLASLSRVISHIGSVRAQVDAFVHGFARDTYYELMFSELQASLFDDARTAIDGKLASSSGDALKKIESISERFRDGDAEAVSQAMSTCRRLIDSVADAVFAAQDEPYMVGEQSLSVKANNVLNRINAYVHKRGITGDRATRIRQSLAGIYGRTSKGVHQDVDSHEARYVFLATYVLLGEILTLPDATES